MAQACILGLGSTLSQPLGAVLPVQVCAPSNSALDEIVLRIMRAGLMDQDGTMWVACMSNGNS
jgi:hypothetical protein